MDINELLKPPSEDELKAIQNSDILAPIKPEEIESIKLEKELEDKEQPGYLESFLRGGAQGATFGFADELTGGIESVVDRLPGETIEQAYQRHRDEARAKYKKAQEANPLTFMAGELVGGLLSGILTGGTGAGASVSRMALSGAAQGALYGLGASENLDQAKEDMKTGAISGGIGGVAAKGLSALLKSRNMQEASKFFKAAREDIPLIGEKAQEFQMKLGEDIYNTVSSSKESLKKGFGKLVSEIRKKGTQLLDLPKDEINKTYNQITSYIQNNPNSEITTGLKPIKNLLDEFFTIENYKNVYDPRIYAGIQNVGKEILNDYNNILKSIRDPKLKSIFEKEQNTIQSKLNEIFDLYKDIDKLTPDKTKEFVNKINKSLNEIQKITDVGSALNLNKNYGKELQGLKKVLEQKDLLLKDQLSLKELEEFQKRLRETSKNIPGIRSKTSKSAEGIQSVVKDMEDMVENLYNQYDQKLANIAELKAAKKAYSSAKDINKNLSEYLNISKHPTYSTGQQMEDLAKAVSKLSRAGTEAENILSHKSQRKYMGELLQKEKPNIEEGIKLLEQQGLTEEANTIRQNLAKLEKFPEKAEQMAEYSRMIKELSDFKKPFSWAGLLSRVTEEGAYKLGQLRGAEAKVVDATRALMKASPDIVKTGSRIIPILNQVEPKEIYNMDNPSLSNLSQDLLESQDPTLKAYGSALNEALETGDIRKKDSIIFSLLQNPKFRNLFKNKK